MGKGGCTKGPSEAKDSSRPDEIMRLPYGVSIARKGRLVAVQSQRTPEEHRSFLSTLRQAASELPTKIDETVAELRKLLLNMPVRQTLSYLALPVFFGDPETYKESEGVTPYVMVEYPTWLYALLPENTLSASKTLDLGQFKSLMALLERAVNQTIQYFMLDSRAIDETVNAFDEIRFRTRLQHLVIRGPAYQHHLRAQLSALFDPFENELRELVGFNFREAIDIVNTINRLEEQRLQDLRVKLSNLNVKQTADQIACELASQSSTIFEFTSADLALALNLDVNAVEKFLNYFSISFGQPEIANSWPSVYEPIERAPLLKFSDGTWLAHLLVKLPWAIKLGLESALFGNVETRKRYERNRAQYLESRAATLISSTARHARKWTRLQYEFDDGEGLRRFELDGLVLVDRAAFLIEGKAGTMSGAARRGAESAISELKELVGDAQLQTNRALRYLNSARETHFFTAAGDDITVRRDDFSRVYLINVTLDPLSAFVTQLAGLRKLGIFKEGELCWSVYELDLQVITEMVEGIGQLVHYLDRRLALEKLRVYATEELDWFGHYLAEGLFLDDFFKDDLGGLFLASYTDALDAYYLFSSGVRKTPAPKPRQSMSLLLRKLVAALERNGPTGFIDAVYLLLEGGSKTRRMITNQIKDRRLVANRVGFAGFRMHLDNCSVICYTAAKKTSSQQIQDYVKAAKFSLKSDYAVGIMQSTVDPNDLVVAVERYRWKEDKNLETLARSVFTQLRSRQLDVQTH